MNEKSLLTCQRLPGRIDVIGASEILGFVPHEITVLMHAGLLKPLGRPAANGHKFFCTAEILELSQSRDWLDKATRVVARRWRESNQKSKMEKALSA